MSSSLNKKLEHVLSEGLSYLQVQLVSCRLSHTWDAQILECHVGWWQGGLTGLQPCTGQVGLTGSPLSLHPAHKSHVLEGLTTLLGLCPLPHAGPELIWCLESDT